VKARPAVPSGRAAAAGDLRSTFALDVRYYL
jgi:hypothetical protein